MNWTLELWRRCAGLCLVVGLMSTAVWAQPAVEEADPPEPKAAETASAAEAEPRERQRLDQIVAVGGDAMVSINQVAEGVVVVRGSAKIEGDVDGDVVVVLGKVTVTGKVRGDVVVVMGEALINGEVTGELAAILTRAKLGPLARIRGHTAAIGMPPEIDPAAQVRGTPEIVSLGPIMQYLEWAKDYLFQGVFYLRPFPPRLGWVWVLAGIFLAFHLALAVIFGGALRGCMDTLRDQPARSFLIGLLACVLVGPISLLLSFTVVATPLLWLAFFAISVFGRVAVYAAAGAGAGRLTGNQALTHPVAALLVGSVLFYVSYMVPVLGLLTYWLVLPWGVGAVLIRMSEALRRERRSGSVGSVRPPLGPDPLASARDLAAGASGPATHAMVGGLEPPLTTTSSEPPPAGAMPNPGSAPGGATAVPPIVPIPALSSVDLAASQRVAFWPRCGATLIDLLVVAFVNFITVRSGSGFWILLAIYHFGMWGWKGTTLGGTVLGLRLIRVDGRPLDWPTAGVRVLGSIVSMLPLGLGFFWVSWDDQFQSWHDRIAGTTIVKSDRRMALV
ncbi:MAG: RDD family protein [Verrucomicrobiales bacterium]|nr:RDD family protein [Verrucomicrobiales bacterium]